MFYCLECVSENVDCEFWLNDLPVTRRGLNNANRFDGPVNEYLIEGMNELSIVIRPPAPHSLNEEEQTLRAYHSAPADAKIKATISQYPFGAIVGGPDAIERVSLEWEINDGQKNAMWPLCKTVEFDIGPGFGQQAWEKADQISLDDPEVINGVSDLLKELHQALSKNDFEAYIKLHGARLDDADTVYRGEQGTRRARAVQELRYEANEGKKMAPLIEDHSYWRLCGESRLVECRVSDGWPNIREEANEKGAVDSYPILAGRIDGKWLALR